jgi:predicted amidohydrolase
MVFQFLLGLSSYTTEQRLSEAFSQYGQVVEGDCGLFICNDIEYPLLGQ